MGRGADSRRLIQLVTAAGGGVRRTARGHWAVTGPAGTVFVTSDMGEPRAWRNALAKLRRVGLAV